MSDGTEVASGRELLRGLLEGLRLRVVDLHQHEERDNRLSAHVLADEDTERDIRGLTNVDVIRYQRLCGPPRRSTAAGREARA